MAFDMSTEDKDKIMKGMMDGTRNLDAWFITGGTKSGIMEYVGEARAKYNPKAPLIGIAPLGVISGGERLRSGGERERGSGWGLGAAHRPDADSRSH